ncbi:radical SAM protein [Archaeoglobus fulgidus]|uniref:Pyruvate formate-lyase activating enzyme (Act-2) n=5 Tax=Archaeoglobus fulgidus TaxID=2234 RepID=O29344_ARCFU|nr:radical SAM protein [Archaeoglobus fulgidus]AAB90319.1 pyruvate formate-lyase activating enzyme (act-2) [Archaeoglobus fulgidus DSM 4304]AIG97789.1 Radical SAM superfamily [Archaeoglobus fulgidus DSM 8774]KUJ92632.1 MAG: Pyruvate formate-lyase activating enzyme (Act-2) [Archaeoglobus fulgidus]
MIVNVAEIKKFLESLPYPKHCIHCEGTDENAENPVHHPSYEVTPSCNLRCIFCYSRVAQLKGTAPKPGYYGSLNPKAITISQYGEPFVVGTSRVVEIIRKLRERFGEVRIDIQTNGTLLEPEILGSEADIVMISLDAGSRESYAEITGKDFFERVVKNIEKMSEHTYTVVRTVFMPGINDEELERIAEIASQADELFLQPLSIYRENTELLKRLDVERAESLGDYLQTAYRLSEIASVRIPGCLLLNMRWFLREFEIGELMLVKRDAFGSVPMMQRRWQFIIE